VNSRLSFFILSGSRVCQPSFWNQLQLVVADFLDGVDNDISKLQNSFFRFMAMMVGFLKTFLLIFLMVVRETLGALIDCPLFPATESSECF
jgi:hypothetical protein